MTSNQITIFISVIIFYLSKQACYNSQWFWIFFDFVVCLKDSVLAFHEHGMQGKSFKKTQVTQEILDGQRTYKLIGADR